MTAKLLIREVGAREFVNFNGDYLDDDTDAPWIADEVRPPCRTGAMKAEAEGERLCAEGNVEAFQVWELVTTKQRVWKLEEVAA